MNARIRSKYPRWLICSFAAAFAYSGLLWEYAERLWSRDFFRFFPVFLVVVLWLTIARLRETPLPKRPVWHVGPTVFLSGVAALIASGWFRSPWLGALSLLLLGDSLLVSQPHARSSWRLLTLLIALPLGLDDHLIHWLQQISSTHASTVLDRIRIPHMMRGNVLEMASRRLFVEEACSGISSIYLLLSVTALYIVSEQVRMVRAIPLLLSVFWWAVVGNVFRIVVIATAISSFNMDLTSGWRHETLGIVTLTMALLGIYSTNSLMRVLFDRILAEELNNSSLVLTPVRLWNLITDRRPRTSRSAGVFSLKLPHRTLLNVLSGLLLVSGGWYWAHRVRSIMASQRPQNTLIAQTPDGDDHSSVMPEFDRLDRSMFDVVADIRVSNFRTETRSDPDDRDLFGSQSRIWDAGTPFGSALVAVDGPFQGWHDLRICYESQGWKPGQTTVHAIPGQIPGRNLVCTRMFDADGQRAHLYFCLVSKAAGLLHVPIGDEDAHVANRIRERLAESLALQSTGRWWQLQLLIQHDGQSLETEIAAEQQLFAELLATVFRQWKNIDGAPLP